MFSYNVCESFIKITSLESSYNIFVLKKMCNGNFDETFTNSVSKLSEYCIKTFYEIKMRDHRLCFSDTDNFLHILTMLQADVLLLWLVGLKMLIGAA